jgi:hypothetical protein
MCDKCSKYYSSGTKHENIACPIMAAMYCSVCATYGDHTTLKCPDKKTWHLRRPEFLSQIIPPKTLELYNISLKTRMSDSVMPCQTIPRPKKEIMDYLQRNSDTNPDLKYFAKKIQDEECVCGICGNSITVSACIDCRTIFCEQCSDQRTPVLEIHKDKDGNDAKFTRAVLSTYNLPVSNVNSNKALIKKVAEEIEGKKLDIRKNEQEITQDRKKQEEKIEKAIREEIEKGNKPPKNKINTKKSVA